MLTSTFYAQPTRTVNPAATLLADIAKRVDRGHNLYRDGYTIFGTPFAPSTYVVLSPKGHSYTVTLDTERGTMDCTCEDFKFGGVGVCKHIAGCCEYRATIDAEGIRFARSMYRHLGHVVVTPHVRGGKRIGCYVRKASAGPLSTAPIPDEAIEAQIARFDQYGSDLV